MMVLDDIVREWPNGFACRVRGTSMEPTLLDGDGVWVDASATTPASGQIVAVNVPGKGKGVGRYRLSDRGAWLDKDNPEAAAIFLGAPDRYAIMGTVVVVCSRPL